MISSATLTRTGRLAALWVGLLLTRSEVALAQQHPLHPPGASIVAPNHLRQAPVRHPLALAAKKLPSPLAVRPTPALPPTRASSRHAP